MSRRSFLQYGVLGTAGLSLADVLRADEIRAGGVAARPRQRVTSVIILWMRGGPSHIDMWDPKPDAPAEFRGEFATVSTKVPGIQLTDRLPLSGRLMDKWSIIRSLHHRPEDGMADHSSGDQICFTGYPSPPDASTNINPSCGSIVARQLQHLNPTLPAYVMIPRMVPGTDKGYFGAAYRPFETGSADPANAGPFRLPSFGAVEGVTVERLGDRRELLGGLDRLRRTVETAPQIASMDQFQQQAWNILSGTTAQKAFDLDSEPQAIRERYGYYPSYTPRVRAGGDAPAWSQRLLLARRLVEAGVRLVTVDCRWWDTHEDNFWALSNGFLPRWDQAYTALITDLEERGLTESTMVLAWGEFGRTPRINAAAGRDHYPAAFSAAMSGGGIQGGRVVGSSDAHGAFPRSNPKIPQDVLATLYRHLGVDVNATYINQSGRPLAALPAGEPIRELF